MGSPELTVLAGPNGAGKSTFFEHFLRRTGVMFVNADILARALAPEDPMSVSLAAARAADAVRRRLVESRESFCTETVFSDPVGAKLEFLREAKARGYRVRLIFIGLQSADLSLARVCQRVAEGGHDVPDEKIFERYPRTLVNLRAAMGIVDEVMVLDNSDARVPYREVMRFEEGRVVFRAEDVPAWAAEVADSGGD